MIRAVRGASAVLVAALGALAVMVLVGQVTDVPAQADVLAVALCVLLGQVAGRGLPVGVDTAVGLVVVSGAATGVGWLLVHARTLGEALLVVGLSAGILGRRWTGVARRVGRVLALPFVALLVTPVPVVAGEVTTGALFLWSAVAAVVAVVWTMLTARLRPAVETVERPPRSSRRRIDVPTRMAVQMLVGLAVALVVGRVLFDDRWAWCVLSAYVVASGNRNRGDVAHKAALRVVGALAGTVVATVATLDAPPGQRSTLVALFGVMTVALVLRERSYAFWAAGMTAMLSLLHAYYGTVGPSGAEQLRERMVGVLLGSAIGVAAAWWVLPVRTRDVFRARLADCLRAVTDQDGSFGQALEALDELAPSLRAASWRHEGARRQLAAIRALHDPVLVGADPPSGALRRDVGRLRRSLVGRDDPTADELVPELVPVLAAIRYAR